MLITRATLAAASNAILKAADELKRDKNPDAQSAQYFGPEDSFLLSMWRDGDQTRAQLEHVDPGTAEVTHLASGTDRNPYRAAVCILATLANRQAREESAPAKARVHHWTRETPTPRNNH